MTRYTQARSGGPLQHATGRRHSSWQRRRIDVDVRSFPLRHVAYSSLAAFATLATNRTIISTACSSVSPCRRTSERHVSKSSA